MGEQPALHAHHSSVIPAYEGGLRLQPPIQPAAWAAIRRIVSRGLRRVGGWALVEAAQGAVDVLAQLLLVACCLIQGAAAPLRVQHVLGPG